MYQTVSVLSQEIELDRPREAAEKQVSFKLKGDLSNSRKDVNTALRWSGQVFLNPGGAILWIPKVQVAYLGVQAQGQGRECEPHEFMGMNLWVPLTHGFCEMVAGTLPLSAPQVLSLPLHLASQSSASPALPRAFIATAIAPSL